MHLPTWLPLLLVVQAVIAGACIVYSGATTWVTGGLTGLLSLSTAIGVGLLVFGHERDVTRLNGILNAEVECRLSEHVRLRNALIFGLAKLADYRDTDTGEHLERICAYSRLLAEQLQGRHDEIDENWLDSMTLASSLHDIGKVGIPDAILLKPGRLTPDERRSMERHAVIGADTLMAIRSRLGDDELLTLAIQIALSHHERWDGTGYPYGLRGEQIPLAARIVALADVYDALTSERVYKAAMPHEEAVSIILDGRGTHFDPDVVRAFERCQIAFEGVRRDALQSMGEDAAEQIGFAA